MQPPKEPVTADEKLQVRARKAIGHGDLLRRDEHGRDRISTGTVESKRLYDMSNGGIVRVRNIDPLKGISSLTGAQRKAGAVYREDFEYASREGMRSIPLQERVDGGRQGQGIPDAILVGFSAYARARQSAGHHEIAFVLDAVCGLGKSIRQIELETSNPRSAVVMLLRIGLDNLALHYGFVPRPKQSA